MTRLRYACVLILLGTVLFGTAVGLVYIDARMHRLELVPGPEDPPLSGPAPTGLIVALCIGPIGAGASLVGMLLGAIELIRTWKQDRPSS